MSLEFEKAYSLQQPPAEGSGEKINNQDIQVTENGIYTAEEGYTGLGTVDVNVQPVLGTKRITENGTYTASSDNLDGYSSVTTDVPKGGLQGSAIIMEGA